MTIYMTKDLIFLLAYIGVGFIGSIWSFSTVLKILECKLGTKKEDLDKLFIERCDYDREADRKAVENGEDTRFRQIMFSVVSNILFYSFWPIFILYVLYIANKNPEEAARMFGFIN